MTAKPRLVLGNAHNRVAPLTDVKTMKSKIRKSSKLSGVTTSITPSKQVKKPLEKEQLPSELQQQMPIFREYKRFHQEEMWTLKRANPVCDSDEEDSKVESPLKRRRPSIEAAEIEDRDDVQASRQVSALFHDERVPETDDGYLIQRIQSH